jgi:hypothetical protein
MWDPSKSHRELKKDMKLDSGSRHKERFSLDQMSCPTVPPEVTATWKSFLGRLVDDSEVWKTNKEAQERVKRAVSFISM